MVTLLVGARREAVHVGWASCDTASQEVRDSCAALLATMPTSLAEDVAALRELDAAAQPDEQSARASLALRYRIAKKQLLSAVAGQPAACAATSAFATV